MKAIAFPSRLGEWCFVTFATTKAVSGSRSIDIHKMSIISDEKPLPDDMSFRLDPNQILVITGDSGSGKTVLLHLAVEILRPDSAEIMIVSTRTSKGKYMDRNPSFPNP